MVEEKRFFLKKYLLLLEFKRKVLLLPTNKATYENI